MTGPRQTKMSRRPPDFRLIVLGLALALEILFLWVLSADGRFLSPLNLENLLVNNTELVFVSFAMTLVIFTGGIDLSVGSILALSGCVAGISIKHGMPVYYAFLIGLATGAACGLFNGLLITAGRMPPLLVTLGTMVFFRGISRGITGGESVSGFPPETYGLATGTLLDLPNQFWMVLGLIPLGILIRKGRWYRQLTAIGGNRASARLSGIPVSYSTLSAYIATGLASGLGAILYVSRFGSVRSNYGKGLELEAITCVVLGGTSIFGGKGSLTGSLLGVGILVAAQNGIPLIELKTAWLHDLASSQEWRTLIIGAILIGVVFMNERLSADKAV